MSRLLLVCLARAKIILLGYVLQYPLAAVIWQVGVVLNPVISLVVWSTVTRTHGGPIAGYAGADFVAYFLVLMVVNAAIFSASMYDIERRIRSGTLSEMLLQPVHPITRDIGFTIATNLSSLATVVPAAVVLAAIFRPALHPAPWAIVAFVPAVLLAAPLRFLVEWTIGLSGFWITRLQAAYATYYMALLFFSGQLAPLELFPHPVQTVAALLPFRWMLQFPVELLLGRLTPAEALAGFAAQGAWLVLSLLVLARVWHAGLRRYSAVGA